VVTADASLANKFLTYQQSRRKGVEFLRDPNPPLHRNIAITAEFVVYLDTIVGALLTGPVD
jgi:hypothetical protein